jgi:hypothetical protein
MTYDDATDLIQVLAAAYPREVTDDMIVLWAGVFQDDDLDRVAEAVGEWIETDQFFPTPAGIKDTMRQHARRRLMEREALPAIDYRQEIGGPAGGFKIAYDSYVKQCKRDGVKPQTYEKFRGKLPRAKS